MSLEKEVPCPGLLLYVLLLIYLIPREGATQTGIHYYLIYNARLKSMSCFT